MQNPTKRLDPWQFSASVLAPILLCLIVTAVAVGGFVVWTTNGIDANSLQRQTSMVRHVLAEQLTQVSHEQESFAVWDDAVIATQNPRDLDWMTQNFGEWSYSYFSHDRLIVIDPSDKPIYAANQGRNIYPGIVEDDVAAIAAQVSKLRELLASDPQTYLQSGRSDQVPRVADFAVVDGWPAIVSLIPIVTDSGTITQPRGTESIAVSIVLLDLDFAGRLMDQYLIGSGSFNRSLTKGQAAAYPVTSASGRFITFFEWEPYRPGATLLAGTAPVLIIGFLLAGLLVLALLQRLWRSSSALEAGRRSAEYQAKHDALTGLANRAHFDDELGRALTTKRPSDVGVALLMLDLDRFKQVNDTLGHQSGDNLIRAVGARLQTLIKPGDTLARLGGDEFGIIHTTKQGLRETMALSRQIIEAIGKPFEIYGSEAFVGVSIGVVEVSAEDSDRREISRKADIALYEAKSTGRNRAVVYEESMNELLQNRHTIEAELREALRGGGQLSVAFQPLFSRETGQIKGTEALARWNNPRLGQVSPAHFVPVAESTGLIEALGDFVLRRACEMGAQWPGLTIAVNISPAQLRNPKFDERVFDLLTETGMSPRDLELEITESILLDDEQTTAESLRTFRRAGIRIALDDFGTGYSSLNYLKRYPVDCIKIDRSFVSQLEPGNVSVAIVQAMVTLAHALRIEVTAEGVETKEQMQILSEMGCNTFQGFLLSAPLTPEAAAKRFARSGEIARVA